MARRKLNSNDAQNKFLGTKKKESSEKVTERIIEHQPIIHKTETVKNVTPFIDTAGITEAIKDGFNELSPNQTTAVSSGLNETSARKAHIKAIENASGKSSTLNSTTIPLSASATYTGTWENISSFSSITIIAEADVAGTLYADFSIDGSTADRTVQLSDGTTADFGIHALIPVASYFRVRVVNGGSNQSSLRVEVLFSRSSKISIPTSRLQTPLSNYTDVINTRAILANINGTNVGVTDDNSLQVTPPPEGKTAFGETLVANLSHELLADFIYNINSEQVTSEANQSGTVTQENAMAKLSTGAAANSSATMYTKDRVRYQPGHGNRARFTALFTTGVANSTQIAGIGDSSNGFFFGYNGTSFGILHRKDGSPEIRTLTVSTASSDAEDITITLDGDAASDVSVTASGVITTTANEIAAHDYSDIGRGWTAYAVGSTVVFVSWDSATHTGSYSLSSATSAVGTFAQTVAGAAPTETWTAQANWNGDDIFDGNGQTGNTIDPTKGNVYQIDYQWLGYGSVGFYIEDPEEGTFHLVHNIRYANANTTPSLSNPTQPIYISAENTSNTSDLIIRSASMGAFTDGTSELIGPRRAVDASVTLGATSAETPFLTIRNNTVFQGKVNTHQIKFLRIGASVEHSKPVEVVFYRDATLTGASFSDLDTATSSLQTDTSATAFTGGVELFDFALGKTGNVNIPLDSDRFGEILRAGETITVTIKPKSGNAAEATVSITFVELF